MYCVSSSPIHIKVWTGSEQKFYAWFFTTVNVFLALRFCVVITTAF